MKTILFSLAVLTVAGLTSLAGTYHSTLTGVDLDDNGAYTVVVTDATGSITTPPAWPSALPPS